MIALLSAVVVVLAVTAAVVLFVPFVVDVEITKVSDHAVDGRVQVRWLGISFPVARSERPNRRTRPARPQQRARSFSWRSVRAVLRLPGFVGRCVRLIQELARTATPQSFHLQARIGFENPADTAEFLGWLYARRPISSGTWRIDVVPSFDGELLEGTVRARWSRNLAAFAAPLIRFAFSPVVWRAARILRRDRSG